MQSRLFKIALVLLLFPAAKNLRAQEIAKKAKASFEKAQESITQMDYPQAISLLESAIKEDNTFQLAYMQLAELCRKSAKYAQAVPYYSKGIALGNLNEARVYYGFGESLLLSGHYQQAKDNLNTFIREYKGKDKALPLKAEKYIRDCDFSINALNHPVKYDPVNLGPGVNSKYRDYFPSITADGQSLIFSRNVEGNEDFYISHKINNVWDTAIPFSSQINTTKYNEGAQSISADGMYLFFTGCNRPDGLGRCDIYVSHKNGKDWGTPFNLGAPVNSPYWESQPSISPDGSTLYFVSNRPGGLGGYDIWKSHLKEDGTWGEPVNLGPEINTIYDEQTPFIHPDGKTLYFSSDGWPGFGSKDIFRSRLQADGHWELPLNLGSPINTFNEETGLIVSPNGTEALFSSILPGGYGDMDIYKFDLPQTLQPGKISYVKGIVKDKANSEPLEAKVRVTELKTLQNQFNDYTSAVDGEFLAVMPVGNSYLLYAEAEGYLFYSDHFDLENKETDKPFQIVIYLEKIKAGANTILKNIFFDTNKYDLLPASVTELGSLAELLERNKNISIEIQGHTDNSGSPAQNIKLSEQRAKAVYDFLLGKGIEATRLSYKGYGESKPIASNEQPSGKQQNRRTSFVITKVK